MFGRDKTTTFSFDQEYLELNELLFISKSAGLTQQFSVFWFLQEPQKKNWWEQIVNKIWWEATWYDVIIYTYIYIFFF